MLRALVDKLMPVKVAIVQHLLTAELKTLDADAASKRAALLPSLRGTTDAERKASTRHRSAVDKAHMQAFALRLKHPSLPGLESWTQDSAIYKSALRVHYAQLVREQLELLYEATREKKDLMAFCTRFTLRTCVCAHCDE